MIELIQKYVDGECIYVMIMEEDLVKVQEWVCSKLGLKISIDSGVNK